MRMRKKPNLIPRMERCAHVQIKEPEDLLGKWKTTFPGYDALYLELGCGKGRFTADTAAQNSNVFLVAIERVPDAMVVGMERVCERKLENVRFVRWAISRMRSAALSGKSPYKIWRHCPASFSFCSSR